MSVFLSVSVREWKLYASECKDFPLAVTVQKMKNFSLPSGHWM